MRRHPGAARHQRGLVLSRLHRKKTGASGQRQEEEAQEEGQKRSLTSGHRRDHRRHRHAAAVQTTIRSASRAADGDGQRKRSDDATCSACSEIRHLASRVIWLQQSVQHKRIVVWQIAHVRC